LQPADFATEGIYLCGLAHAPKSIEETIAQAQAAAARAATILSRAKVLVGGAIAVVEQDKCVGCLTCVRICPYHVPRINAQARSIGNIAGAAEIEAALCQGCGICVGECPAKAIQLLHYRDDQVLASITALREPEYA
jgi:heterodisulfide reductase subunit A-like polyferredoxin